MNASGSIDGVIDNTTINALDDNALDALTIRTDLLAEWGEPDCTLLDDRRGELPEFPVHVLSAPLRDFIERASAGAGVTFAHVAVPLLSISSGIIGTARRVQASRSWTEPLSIWSALVGFSGTGKTPGIGVTKLALNQIERNWKDKLAELARQHETRLEAAKAAYKKWLNELEEATIAGLAAPQMPLSARKIGPFVAPRVYVSDSTIERISVLLEARPAGLQLIADELAGLFANMSRYSNGSDREFWLEAWNGRSYTVERMARPAVTLDHLLVGISGGLQPDKLVRAFEGDDDGMYARICFAWPSEPGYRPLSNETSEIEPELINALEKLVRFGDLGDDGTFAPRTIPLSHGAVKVFEQFRQFLHLERDNLDGREREWWAKGATQVLRIGGTLAFLSWAWTRHAAEPTEIDATFIEAAVAVWRDYFWPHSRAALRQIGVNRNQSHVRRAARWIFKNRRDDISLMDIRRDALSQRLDAKQTAAIIETLVQARWLKPHTTATGGRPAQRWWVNPALYWGAGSAGSARSKPTPLLSALSALSASALAPQNDDLGGFK